MPRADGWIEGVVVQSLGRICDERGTIMHGVRRDTILNDFGEVYFKKLYRDVINGWHVHETLILNYICLWGMMKTVLYDMRAASPTHGMIQEVFYGDDNYVLVHVPPGVANASKVIRGEWALFCNVASEPHRADLKYMRIDPLNCDIPYDWNQRHY
jgi:dTDP-4-dehydrorhamnose 3,5-epimerase